MTKLSAYVAIVTAVFLGIAEVVRNWGDWQWWPFWLVDYIACAFLLAGAVIYLRRGAKAWLTGAWGFFVAMLGVSMLALFAALVGGAHSGAHGCVHGARR